MQAIFAVLLLLLFRCSAIAGGSHTAAIPASKIKQKTMLESQVELVKSFEIAKLLYMRGGAVKTASGKSAVS